jgi:hypothetical protein
MQSRLLLLFFAKDFVRDPGLLNAITIRRKATIERSPIIIGIS